MRYKSLQYLFPMKINKDDVVNLWDQNIINRQIINNKILSFSNDVIKILRMTQEIKSEKFKNWLNFIEKFPLSGENIDTYYGNNFT